MALIHPVVSGEGNPPIVFVHGFSCDHTDWRLQVAEFSKRHKTVAVDLSADPRFNFDRFNVRPDMQERLDRMVAALGDADEPRQRKVEHAEGVRLSDRQMDGEGGAAAGKRRQVFALGHRRRPHAPSAAGLRGGRHGQSDPIPRLGVQIAVGAAI